jgi:SAM-dependent methyltransferase
MTDPVRTQYEALPYPPRDPRDEAKRLITGSPSRLPEVNHYVFGGRRDFTKPFRALVAGGGTGDAAIMLAQQLTDTGAAHTEVVYLDWSTASRGVAEARAKVRQLTNLNFVTGSLLEYASLGLGQFDYIDCCGVLHHLPDPPATLAALVASLAPDGGMGMMLYGRLGRTGVYPAQTMLRELLADTDDVPTRLAVAKKLITQLPATNWLKRNPFVTDHIVEGDAGVFDLLLHARDRAYDVNEIAALLGDADLRLVSFAPPARYEPASYLSDATLLRRLEGKPMLERAAFAENLAGNIKSHVFYAVRAGNAVPAPAPDNPHAVPVYCEPETAELARKFKPGTNLSAGVDGWTVKLPLPSLTAALAELIDGKRSLREIHGALSERRADLTWDDFLAQFRMYFAAFNGVGHLMLRLP